MGKKKDTKTLDAFNKKIDDRVAKSKNVVKQEFETRKRLGLSVSDSYNRLATKALDAKNGEEFISFKRKADFIKNCDSKSLFIKCPTHMKSHLVYARYCKQRLCPVCNYKKSQRNKSNLLKLFDFMSTQQDYKFDKYYHTVFTVPNVKISFDNIEDGILMVDAMYKGISLMIKDCELFHPYYKKLRNPLCNLRRKKNCSLDCEYLCDDKCSFDKNVCGKPCIVGSIVVLEFTIKYSHARKQWEIHPHFHVLFAIQSDYHKHKRRFKVLNNRQWGYMWQYYLEQFIDVEKYRMQLINASSKNYTQDEIKKSLAEPLQCKVEMAYDKKVNKDTFMKDCEEYVNKLDTKSVDDEITEMTTFTIGSTMNQSQKDMIKERLKAIQKTIKAIPEVNKDAYKFKTVKEAMAAYEKERYSAKGALAEIAKYTTKDFGAEGVVRLNKDGSIRRKDTDLVVYSMDNVLNGRRLMELRGSFKKANKYLKLRLEEDLDESDEITGGTDDCHWIFEDGKFLCLESDATMSYLVKQFDMKTQRYEQSESAEDVDYLADYVVGYYNRQLDKKSATSEWEPVMDDEDNPFLSNKKTDVSDQTNISK